jgi:transcriptional regulator with XRE-family HTH domain
MPDPIWGERLKRVLVHRSETQSSVARHLNVSPAAVNKWTAGGQIDHATLVELGAFLKVNHLWLRHGSKQLADLQKADIAEVSKHWAAILINAWQRGYMEAAKPGFLIGCWELDLTTTQAHWSIDARRLYQIDPITPATHSKFLELISPHDHDDLRAALADTIVRRQNYDFSFELREHPEVKLRSLGMPVVYQDKVIKVHGIVAERDVIDEAFNLQLKIRQSSVDPELVTNILPSHQDGDSW